VPLAWLTSDVLRIVLGLAFVLFSLWCALIVVLFPKNDALDSSEHLPLCFGLSIAVAVFMGHVLNCTLWDICRYPVLIFVLVFLGIKAGTAWYRRRELWPERCLSPQLFIHLLSSRCWVSQGSGDKILSILFLIAIAGAIGTFTYVITTPKAVDRFTEFYILSLDRKAEDYPQELALGEQGKVILGIVNRERETTEYWVEITIDEERVGQVGPITLDHEEKWERAVSFTPIRAGPNQKVEFLLYKGDGTEPYLRLHLWLDVGKEAK